MLRDIEKKEISPLYLILTFILLYLFFTIETIFPFYCPEFSLIFLILSSLTFSPLIASLLGFFLGFLSDHLLPSFFGRYSLFFTLLSFALSSLKNYLIPSYFYLLLILFFSLLLKGLLGGFHLIKLVLTLILAIPFTKLIRKITHRTFFAP